MNRMLFILLLASAAFAQTYTVDVDREGVASVTASLEAGEAINITMPADASSIRIVGGSYSMANGTAFVYPGQGGFATFSFSSALLTSKSGGSWHLAILPPAGSDVRVYMPAYASIDNSFPQPGSVSSEDSRTRLEYGPAKAVNVYYTLQEPPQQQADSGQVYLAAAAIIAVAAIISAYLLRSGSKAPSAQSARETPAASAASALQERRPSLEMTAGKKEMMETFNENDTRIVGILLGSGGKSRRNELERKSGISKSSLAMALNRLEKRKILEIDRTSTTHFVKLSDYFLRL